MRAKQYDGTVIRWIWGGLEPLFPAGYLIGTLTAILYENDTVLPMNVTAPHPIPPPYTIYIDQEQMNFTGTAAGFTVDRGVNGTKITTHNTFAEVRADSYHPIAREYSLGHESPIHFRHHTLSCVEMTLSQLAAAKQDDRLTILPSIHSAKSIPAALSTALAKYGVNPTDTMNDMLTTLGALDARYLPDN